jgi:BirA family transcriptional regulator, biotin operon repressor / biotin---[acetyl-CoA-carboxylase] ligase
MDAASLQTLLKDLPLGPLRYFDRLGSTNDEAGRWAEAGTPDLSMVLADEQTAGRGRLHRRWYTPPGSALAFSLVLRPTPPVSGPEIPPHANRTGSPSQEEGALADLPVKFLPRLSALSALSVCTALQANYGLAAQIKWPNDVLVGRRKLAGVLAEANWIGDRLAAVILGVGVNVSPPSVPAEEQISFPATCVEAALGAPVDRWELLKAILAALLGWRSRLGTIEFWQAWEDALAFRGEMVDLYIEGSQTIHGQVLGLDREGALRLRVSSGRVETIQFGEVRLRPVDSLPKSAKLGRER